MIWLYYNQQMYTLRIICLLALVAVIDARRAKPELTPIPQKEDNTDLLHLDAPLQFQEDDDRKIDVIAKELKLPGIEEYVGVDWVKDPNSQPSPHLTKEEDQVEVPMSVVKQIMPEKPVQRQEKPKEIEKKVQIKAKDSKSESQSQSSSSSSSSSSSDSQQNTHPAKSYRPSLKSKQKHTSSNAPKDIDASYLHKLDDFLQNYREIMIIAFLVVLIAIFTLIFRCLHPSRQHFSSIPSVQQSQIQDPGKQGKFIQTDEL